MKCEENQFNCPVEATLSLIGGKYKPLILWHLIDHPFFTQFIHSISSFCNPLITKSPFCQEEFRRIRCFLNFAS